MDDTFQPIGDLALIDLVKRRQSFPITAFIRPCEAIAPEALSGDGGLFSPLSERYSALTENLPLCGAAMLKTDAAGEIALIARLRARAPWLEPAIASIERQLRIQIWAGRPWIAWRPICLTGSPGTGKSYLARLIGDLAGTGHATLDFGGVSDNRTLEGTSRGWNAAQPCWPAVVMSQTRTANPVLVVEELEKAGGSAQNGAPHATLLTMTERETAARFWDKCLLAQVDLSHACWIMTSNSVDRLPAPLRSRLDIVAIEGPEPEHLDTVMAVILSDLAAAWEVPQGMLPDIPPRAVRVLRESFAKTRSVRLLRRNLEKVVAAMIPIARKSVH